MISTRIAGPRLVRLARYGGVSVLSAVLAQAGLALGYGVLRWTTMQAVGLSLIVSVVPAYWLNRRHVWRERPTRRAQPFTFALLAVTGSVVTALTTSGAEHFARAFTHDHTLLTLTINAAALLTTVAVWLARFAAFDRLVFADRRPGTALRIQS